MRFLNKTLFKLASEKLKGCPTKLYYVNKDIYHNRSIDDSFLDALKEGGFQVGALAKQYIGNGVDLENINKETALQRTQELLTQENVIIYEATFRHRDLEIRCDILTKKGNNIEIIEVKSKSFARDDDCFYVDESTGEQICFLNNKGYIDPDWRDYILDISFQSYVVNNSLSNFSISYYLMLIDKDSLCPVDGLNQKFIIDRKQSSKKVKIISKLLTDEDKSSWILKKVNVNKQIKIIQDDLYYIDGHEMSFETYIHKLAHDYVNDNKIITDLGGKCKYCEFFMPIEEITERNNSGFHECWKNKLGWSDKDFQQKTVLDLWNSKNKNKLINDGKLLLDQLSEDDFKLKNNENLLEQVDRQWMQVEKYQNKDHDIFIHPKLADEISKWAYPLHFIDFETCTTAMPFNKGHHPYEPIAFQFSHHILYENGNFEHIGQYIETKPNYFPNFDFVQELKNQLDLDQGTIFRFSTHENTILNSIHKQLHLYGDNVKNKNELLEFIEHITKKTKNKKIIREGARCMVDLDEVLKKYTFFPSTNGRTSMKVIFPAILEASKFLQDKYSKPIYGSKIILSKNFTDWQVVEKKGDQILDPYKRLPGVNENISVEDLELFDEAERISDFKEIREGGMASTAYALMQFTNMSDIERQAITNSLLKYCELDTLAMVILYEFLFNNANN